MERIGRTYFKYGGQGKVSLEVTLKFRLKFTDQPSQNNCISAKTMYVQMS